MIAVIAVLIIDTSLIKASDLYSTLAVYSWSTAIFIILVAVSIVGQFLLLGFVKQKTEEMMIRKETLHLNAIHNIVSIVQYALSTILILAILQIVVTGHYNSAILTSATGISYLLAISMMGLLAQRFFSWFKSNRNIIVLSYGIASATLAINTGFTLTFGIDLLLSKPLEVWTRMGAALISVSQSDVTATLNYAYIISSIVSFIATWVATALLLHHYSHRLGVIKFWVIISIPLVYFLSQFLSIFLNLFAPYLQSDPIFYGILLTLIFTLSKVAGGIFFGIGFWLIARHISADKFVREYLIISAYGLVLFFISNQGVAVANEFYPPFGLATVIFAGISSYLILVGIYSSAISVSQDVKLRQSIRKVAIEESRLLDSIGTSHMEQEIQDRVNSMTKQVRNTMLEETALYTSLSEEDVKSYMEQVLQEVKKGKVQNGDK
jgi:hypothetical protein